MAYNIGPKIGIDGETEFRNSITKINVTYKALEAEMRALTESFEENDNEQAKLEETAKLLQKQIENQKEKVTLLEDAIQRATAKYDKNSTEVIRLEGVMYDAQASIATFEKELKNTNNQLEESKAAMEESEDSTDKYKQAAEQLEAEVKSIETASKTLASETKMLTAAFEDSEDEQDRLKITSQQLQKQIELQEQKVKKLEEAVRNASDQFGENSDEATRLKGAMYDAQASVAKLESELKNTNSRLDDSEEAMEDFEEATDDAGEQAVDFGDILKANVISDAIMDGLRELVNYMKEFASDSIEEAASMQAITAQTEQTFGTMEAVASAALEEISEDVGIASTRMQESFNKIYSFAKTSGASAETALTISSRAMVAAADNAAYYDKSIEDATETLQAFLKGNYANDAALGISCTETTRNAKANELYAKSFSTLSESQKVDVLLAMVEAGNEASGAIGQAARESDGWENVTGELAEVMRLLQAEAGKPALQKLVPIIQNLTEAGYELIEDIDWDIFAERVEDIADGVVEKGPSIIKTIASVAAGIVAFKAVQKAQEIANVATSFLQIGTAATETLGTLTTTGLAAAATPWGAAALVIGGAAALITAYALQADTDAEKLASAMDKLETRMEDANSNYADTTEEIEGTAYAAEHYVSRLQELEEQGLDTAAAHKEYELIVEELNEILPDLNLTINEQTGLIDQNVDSLYNEIDAWKENATQQALQERFTDILSAQGKAQASLLEAQVRKNILEKEGQELTEQRIAAQEELEEADRAVQEAMEDLADATAEGAEAQALANDKLVKAQQLQEQKTQKVREAIAAEEENAEAVNNLAEEIENAEVTIDSYSEEVELASATLALFNEESESVTEAQVELNQAIEDLQNALDSMESAYAEVKEEAMETISKQIDLFGELAEEADYSTEKVIENWLAQAEALQNYEENLQKAAEKGIAAELIEQLSDGSEESMLILSQWADATEAEVASLNEAYAKLIGTAESAAETVAKVTTGYDTNLAELKAQAKESGLCVTDGLVTAIEEELPVLEKTMNKAADKTVTSYNSAMSIKSPSRRMMPSGRHTVGGVVKGVEDSIKEMETAMEGLASAGESAYLRQQLERAAEYPTQVIRAGSSSSTKVDHNYGGINIQVYAAEGQSEESIANAVMEKIRTEIMIKGASL